MMGFELLFIPLILCAVVAVVLIAGVIGIALGWRPSTNLLNSAQNKQTPVDILKERYARGEINREEYDQMRLGLEG
jgi:putative membrane protein